LVNYARLSGINPDDALERTNKKFKYRFQFMENEAEIMGKGLKEMTLDEMEELWVKAKG
jgi:XTP/dITP diphosphohydrolase